MLTCTHQSQSTSAVRTPAFPCAPALRSDACAAACLDYSNSPHVGRLAELLVGRLDKRSFAVVAKALYSASGVGCWRWWLRRSC